MKKITMFLTAFVLCGLITNAQVDLKNGLVAYYPFNGNANDESGNGNDGTVNGATLTADRFGNVNSAYNFNGSNNIICPANNLINNDYTYSVWINCNSIPVNDATSPISIGSAADQAFSLVNDGLRNGWGLTSYTYPNENGPGAFINELPIINKWYHILMVRTNFIAKIYINGVLKSSVENLGYNADYGVSPTLTIGCRADNAQYFDGFIDDIRIYNRVLNEQEIQALYNEGVCYQTIETTETLVINANITSYNPITFQNSISIYPNPAKDQINIDFGSNYATMSGYTLKIVNSISQTVYTTGVTQQNTSVKLNTWTGNGTYFVHLIDNNGNTVDVKKIILQ